MKYKIGDRVKSVEAGDKGRSGVIIRLAPSNPDVHVVREDNGDTYHEHVNFMIKTGDTMSKYDDLKERISQVEGWTKEADDILQEICPSEWYINIPIRSKCGVGNNYIDIRKTGEFNNISEKFNFNNQCEKNDAFKEAMMYLLDHSDIKNDKKEQIAEIKEQVRELNDRVEKMEQDL